MLNTYRINRPIDETDIVIFLRQFATLLSAGISIIQCCDILEKSQYKIKLRLLIYAIKREILTGKNLSHSLTSHAHHFNALTRQLIIVGEQTGKLEEMLLMIAQYQENHLLFKKRIKQALFYPCILLLTACCITLGICLFLIPRFADLFQNAYTPLPLLTQLIFATSAFLRHYFFYLSVLLILLFYTVYRFKEKIKPHLLHLPLINAYFQKLFLSHFARHLAITFTAGIPIHDALGLLATTTPPPFNHSLYTLRSKMNTGLQLHLAMDIHFPLLMIQMVKIGEESGKLDLMLIKLANFYEGEIDHFLSKLTQLLEPFMMIFLGILIGTLVIGLYLPIFKLGNTI